MDSGIIVLGTTQDAGFPHAGCQRTCCQEAWNDPSLRRHAACLALYNAKTHRAWLFDATPDLKFQLHMLNELTEGPAPELAGIFLTHAHIGHYTGLIHLGQEGIGTDKLPVYAMPRMQSFLSENGPWSQLIQKQNISLHPLTANQATELENGIQVTPLLVPHRDEFSETVGFRIASRQQAALFIPDIDKWDRWDREITTEINASDVAYLDGTFYDQHELPGRDMSTIPHPLITDSLDHFAPLPPEERNKIRFIHLNHTNPALQQSSTARQHIEDLGFHLAEEKETFPLSND
jgi:pyrroloquinoline quinone biosynthesis protein B